MMLYTSGSTGQPKGARTHAPVRGQPLPLDVARLRLRRRRGLRAAHEPQLHRRLVGDLRRPRSRRAAAGRAGRRRHRSASPAGIPGRDRRDAAGARAVAPARHSRAAVGHGQFAARAPLVHHQRRAADPGTRGRLPAPAARHDRAEHLRHVRDLGRDGLRHAAAGAPARCACPSAGRSPTPACTWSTGRARSCRPASPASCRSRVPASVPATGSGRN